MDAGAGAVLVVMGMAALIAVVGALVEFGRRRRERRQVVSAQLSKVKRHRVAPTKAAADPGCGSPDASGSAAPHHDHRDAR
ncbi:hypothetical protein JJ691_83690 [Kutzneria sp. CA-103260]|nr:hypothetical protein JJ691_83690 [Kutzneria sp. CA-103260]